jgi:hypothetical protein
MKLKWGCDVEVPCPNCDEPCAGEWGEDGPERSEPLRCGKCRVGVCPQCSQEIDDVLNCDKCAMRWMGKG